MAKRSKGAKHRHVVAVFHDGARLREALRALDLGGVRASNLCLLAGQKTVEDRLHPSLEGASRDILSSLLNAMAETGTVYRFGPVLVSAGSLANFFSKSQHEKPKAVGSLLERWLLFRHAVCLQEELDAGGCLLWVRVRDGEEERRACGILLRHSERPVQVHDLIPG